MNAPLPVHEAERLRELSSYEILDTPPDVEFDDIVLLASALCNCPIAAISLVDAERQWFKARVGLTPTETSRDIAFCAHAILDVSVMQVSDASADPRFQNNPLVTGELGIRFYAGFPLVGSGGLPLGTLCVIDKTPREISATQLESLQSLGRLAVTQLELRRTLIRNRDAQRRIAQSEEALSMAVVAGSIGLWNLNLISESLTMSTLLETMLELSHVGGPHAARELFDRVHPEDRAALEESMHEAIVQRSQLDIEFRVLLANGQVRWLQNTGIADYDADGDAIRMTGTARDITDRKRVESEVRLHQERLDLAAQASKIGVWDWTTETEEWFVSGTSAGILGWPPSVSPTLAEWQAQIHPDDRAPVEALVSEKLADPRCSHWAIEHRAMRLDGSVCWLGVNARVMRNAEGVATRMTGTHRDITEAKQRELVLAEARTNADQANSAKSAFLANVSHEIRTPMHGIIGMAHLLAESTLNSEQRDYLNGIEASAQSLLHLVNDMLDVAKIEAGKVRLDVHAFAMGDLLQLVHQQVRAAAAEKKLKLDLVLAPELDLAFDGDMTRLRQVLLNLLGNAIKFTDRGSVTLHVSQDGGTEERPMLRFEVTDTGIGIPESARASLFRPFQQVDSSGTRRFQGTGLGLAICKNLVQLMAGTIGVDAHTPHGSTFWVLIPIPVSESKPVRVSMSQPPTSRAKPMFVGRNVLVVEDNEINQKIVAARLKKMGFRLRVARNGQEALDAVEEFPFDLVLMDCQMPVMDGYEATEHIRSHPDPSIAALPIIAMTANAMYGERERCLDAGMNDLVTKPFDDVQFLIALQRWLPTQTTENATPAGAVAEVFDREAFARVTGAEVGVHNALASELLELFISGTPAVVEAMNEGHRSQNLQTIRRAVHTLRSNAAYVGGIKLEPLCSALESAVVRTPVETQEVTRLVEGIQTAHAELVVALRTLK
jgi:signal transduction histidine kinase/CheY-like chemotaxis protein/HPt (histidine-containing phosphotransfer) domain-containing protein